MPIANDTDAAPGHMGVNPAMDRILSRAAAGNASAAATSSLPADSAQTIIRDSNTLDSSAIATEDYDDYESLPDNTTLAHHLAAGAFAGIMVSSISHFSSFAQLFPHLGGQSWKFLAGVLVLTKI